MSNSFSFYFSVYKDELYAVRLAYQLNKYYPGVEVIVISDGPYDVYSLNVAKQFNSNLKVIEGERLKAKPTGGCEFTHRNFETILNESSSEKFIKLDPDSYINRFCSIPNNNWFGHVHYTSIMYLDHQFNFVAGGAMGLSRYTIQTIFESKYLLNKKYDDVGGFYHRYKRYKKFGDPTGEKNLIRREDWVLGDVCRKLKIEPTPWSDVYCVQDEEIEDNSFAIIHPVRTRW